LRVAESIGGLQGRIHLYKNVREPHCNKEENATVPDQKYCIIHGHFYQPPRENPWHGTIDYQPSARPDHDWNERIYKECYRPNGYSRLLQPDGRIENLINNYRYLSFNFGPTLLRWLEHYHPDLVDHIVAADTMSREQNGGHGNAIGQVFNHIIMPLAPYRDQLTQIQWAKADFKRIFQRDTEGLWLAETAINMETVRALIETEIKFVVLSPNQASKFRPLGTKQPLKAGLASINRPYRLFLRDKKGKKCGGYIDIFFFNEALSRAVSFEGLLHDSAHLTDRILKEYDPNQESSQGVVIATDGETFGHHKQFGDMCLAHFFTSRCHEHNIIPTNFAFFLENAPPENEVLLHNEFDEGCAWSCAHGTGRWYRDCGCNTGGGPGWNQQWRTPLRQAFDLLRDRIYTDTEQWAQDRGIDFWRLRDKWLPDKHSVSDVKNLLSSQLRKKTDSHDYTRVYQLLQAHKYCLYSYTSCGWFFSDVTGIEPVQNMAYAVRAIQLAFDAGLADPIVSEFKEKLHAAKSNIDPQTALSSLEQWVEPQANHFHISAAGSAVVHVVLQRSKNQTGNYKCSIVRSKKLNETADGASQHFVVVEVTNAETLERARMAVQVRIALQRGVSCYVLNEEQCTRLHLEAASRARFKNAAGAIEVGLMQFFEHDRQMLSVHLQKQVSAGFKQHLHQWVRQNKLLLDNFEQLGSVEAPLGHLFSLLLQQEWEKAGQMLVHPQQCSGVSRAWHTIAGRADRVGVVINKEKSAKKCMEMLMEIFSQPPEQPRLAHAIELVGLYNNFSLPLNTLLLQETFFRYYYQYIETADESQKKMLIYLAEHLHFYIQGGA